MKISGNIYLDYKGVNMMFIDNVMNYTSGLFMYNEERYVKGDNLK